MPRNFRRIAELMQSRRQPPESSGGSALDTAMDAIAEAAIAAQAGYLERTERQRRATAARCREAPRYVVELPILRLIGPPPLSSSEAAEAARHEFRKQREKGRLRHWSFDPGRMAAAWEAAVIARYFRRFGKAIWLKEAA